MNRLSEKHKNKLLVSLAGKVGYLESESTDAANKQRLAKAMKFKSSSRLQIFLLPPTVDELVPQADLVRVVAEVVDELDLSPLYRRYYEDGRPPFHPKLMLSVLFYAYSNGIRSSRQIAQRLQRDTHFMFLAARETPDFRTISDFRKNHLDLLKVFFKQIVLYCVELGMVSVGHISIDGTKIKASASKKQTRDADSLQKEIDKLEKEICEMIAEAEAIDAAENQTFGNEKRGDEIPHALRDKQLRRQHLHQAKELLKEKGWDKINLTDTDARFMKTPNAPAMEVAYNAQLAVDSDHQVIIANDAVTAVNDQNQFVPIFEQVVDNVGQTPKKSSADCGYATHKTYEYIQQHSLDVYLPDAQAAMVDDPNNPKSRYTKDKFRYDEANDCYLCPEGRPLDFLQIKIKADLQGRVYRSRDCRGCPATAWCLRKNNKSHRKLLHIYATDPVIHQMRQKLNSPEGKAEYRQRLSTVEPPFGNLKQNLGFRYFLVRGHEKVRGEFNLMCIAHNLRKIHQYQLNKAA